MPPEQLSLDRIRPFVPRTELRQVFSNLPSRRNHPQLGYNPWFFYPAQGGIQTLCEALPGHRADVRLEHEAIEIDLNHCMIQFQNGQRADYDRLISTKTAV